VSILQIKSKLAGGYQRDFQLLKEPLMRGLERTAAMLAMVAHAVPQLQVDRVRCAAALAGGALATDEVMRRVELGQPFRTAYRQVAAALGAGDKFPAPSPAKLIARRTSTGGVGNLGLNLIRARLRRGRTWHARERRRFDRALRKLTGRSARPPARPPARPS